MRRLLITFFYSGLSPVAPGTAGSLAISVALCLLFFLIHPAFWVWQICLLAGLILACGISVALGPWAIQTYGRKDPQLFVMDEVAGICLTNLFLPIQFILHSVQSRGVGTLALAFLAFRLFDVTKPPPARQLEKLPGGWGILTDDLAAAVYANLVCQVLLRLVL